MFTNEEILEYIKMPQECSRLALECLDRLKDNQDFIALKERFYNDLYTMHRIDRLAEELGEPHRMVRMAFCLFCTDRMYELFKEQGMSDQVYLDSLIDLRVWALTCMKNYGEWGMEEFKWLANALRGKLYRLGRLQFEKIPYPYDSYEAHGVSIKKGDIVIGTHIPEDGRLTYEGRIDSYKQAYAMFGNPVFICESYLLYPAQYDFLPKGSNILEFMNEFDIVYSEENGAMKDMWRIFGMRDSYDPKDLPRDTSLQRAYADHIAKTGVNGMGYGVLVFDGEKILTKKN